MDINYKSLTQPTETFMIFFSTAAFWVTWNNLITQHLMKQSERRWWVYSNLHLHHFSTFKYPTKVLKTEKRQEKLQKPSQDYLNGSCGRNQAVAFGCWGSKNFGLIWLYLWYWFGLPQIFASEVSSQLIIISSKHIWVIWDFGVIVK